MNQVSDHSYPDNHPEIDSNLSDQFKFIQKVVSSHLQQIIDENTQRQTNDRNAGIYHPESFYNVAEEFNNNNQDLINDVGSDEFVAKNIRVRPTSGMTVADKEEKSDIYGGKQSMLD